MVSREWRIFACHVASQEWRVFMSIFGTWEKKKRKRELELALGG